MTPARTGGDVGVRRTAPGRRARLAAGTVAVLAAALATSLLVPMGSASADPSATTWHRLRMCESSDNYSIDTGNAHYGAYQFDLVDVAQRRRQRLPEPRAARPSRTRAR